MFLTIIPDLIAGPFATARLCSTQSLLHPPLPTPLMRRYKVSGISVRTLWGFYYALGLNKIDSKNTSVLSVKHIGKKTA